MGDEMEQRIANVLAALGDGRLGLLQGLAIRPA
jgi:hypothetical protein